MLQLTLTLCAQNNSTMALFTHCQRRTKLRTEVLPTALLQPLLGLTYNLLQQGVRFERCAAAQRQAPLWQRVRTLGYQAAQHYLSVWLHSRRCTCRRLFGIYTIFIC